MRELYLAINEIFDFHPTDPRLPAFADRVVAFIEAAGAKAQQVTAQAPIDDHWLTEEIIDLLDSAFLDSFPAAPRILELLEKRGYTGWTNIRQVETHR